jgi:hypothetical protein
MDYTITELSEGKAVVTFADGAWAEIPVLTADTKEVFDERVQGYATKLPQSNPAWIAVSQTGSVTQEIYAVLPSSALVPDELPAWLVARKAAYGAPSSQIEFIAENGLAAWQTEVARIKTLHPQPE